MTSGSWHQAPLRVVINPALKSFTEHHHSRFGAAGAAVSVPANTAMSLTLLAPIGQNPIGTAEGATFLVI
jgi:hypothetical protein